MIKKKEYMIKELDEKSIRMIILSAMVIQTIQGKLGMPRKIVLFKERSIAMASIQSENKSGYYTVPFDGLELWETRNGDLATTLQNQEKKKASAADVAYSKGQVVLSLNEFIIYINALARENQKEAVSIIETALCVVIPFYKRVIIDFKYVKGPGSGVITLISAAVKEDGKRVSGTYQFQYGYMVEGVIEWAEAISLPKNIIVVKGLKTGVIIYFRKRSATSKSGMSKWCEPIFTSLN